MKRSGSTPGTSLTVGGVTVRGRHLAYGQFAIGGSAAKKIAAGNGVGLPRIGHEISLGLGIRRRGTYDRHGVWWLVRSGRGYELHFHERGAF